MKSLLVMLMVATFATLFYGVLALALFFLFEQH